MLEKVYTGMKPARMLQAVIRRLEELQVSPEYSSKIVTMLAYYLEGKHSEVELAEFNDVLRRWEEMSIQLRYIGKERREEGRAEGIRRGLAAYLNIRFNIDEETTAQKLAGLHDPKVLEELAKASSCLSRRTKSSPVSSMSFHIPEVSRKTLIALAGSLFTLAFPAKINVHSSVILTFNTSPVFIDNFLLTSAGRVICPFDDIQVSIISASSLHILLSLLYHAR